MATSPQFAITPKFKSAVVSVANTNRDGTGTLVDITGVAGATGQRVGKIKIKAQGTTTAGMIRIFMNDGTNIRIYEERSVTALTPSGTVQSFSDTILYSDANAPILESGQKLQAATHNAETFNIFTEDAEY